MLCVRAHYIKYKVYVRPVCGSISALLKYGELGFEGLGPSGV